MAAELGMLGDFDACADKIRKWDYDAATASYLLTRKRFVNYRSKIFGAHKATHDGFQEYHYHDIYEV